MGLGIACRNCWKNEATGWTYLSYGDVYPTCSQECNDNILEHAKSFLWGYDTMTTHRGKYGSWYEFMSFKDWLSPLKRWGIVPIRVKEWNKNGI